MDDEFDRIIELFSLETEEKEKKLDEIFHLSMSFIEKYKHIQEEGDEKDKERILKKMAILKEKISLEKQASEEGLSLSTDEIAELSNDEKNFTEEQWKLLQKTKKSISQEKAAIAQKKKSSMDHHISQLKDPSKKKRRTKRGKSSWLKS